MRNKKSCMKIFYGFTLIELLVTLTLVSILLSTAVPSFIELIKDNRLVAQINEFVATVNFARSEAIKRGLSVRVTSSSGNNWANGWQVWVDLNNNEIFDNGESLQVKQNSSDSGTTFVSGSNEFIFDPHGASSATDTLTLCDDRTGESGKQISIGLVGRVTLNAAYTCL